MKTSEETQMPQVERTSSPQRTLEEAARQLERSHESLPKLKVYATTQEKPMATMTEELVQQNWNVPKPQLER